MQSIRTRSSARLLVIDPEDRILLFRFVLTGGDLAVRDYWATPGGSLEDKETYAQAARRELFEETGFVSAISDTHVTEREFILQMPDGEEVLAKERFFVARVTSQSTLIYSPQALRCLGIFFGAQHDYAPFFHTLAFAPGYGH